MIERDEMKRAGWTDTEKKWPTCYSTVWLLDRGLNVPPSRADYDEWYELSINPGHSFDKEWTVIQKHLKGGIAGSHEIEQIYAGRIADYNALVLLMDWLGIKSSPPKINEQTGNNSYQDRGNTWFTLVLLPILTMKGVRLDDELRNAWKELTNSLR